MYQLYFADGTRKVKNKYCKIKSKAVLIHQDLDRIEILATHGRLNQEDITYALHLKYITPDEAQRLISGPVCTVPANQITWDRLADIYYSHIRTVGSASTRRSYPYKIRPILAYFTEVKPYEVDERLVHEYITNRRLRVSKATVNKEIIALRVMFDHLVEIGMISKNPARAVSIFSNTPERLPRCLTPDELKKILLLVKDYYACYGYFSELIHTYLFTGMRRYELLNLKQKDVDLQNKLLHINGKGDKDRMIEIHPILEAIFHSVITKNQGREGPYFFGGHDKPLMTDNSMGRAFRVFLRRHNLYNNNSLHTLRHTFLTYLLDSGVPLKKVQQIAGHSSLKTTFKYTHLVPSNSPAINRLDYDKYIKPFNL